MGTTAKATVFLQRADRWDDFRFYKFKIQIDGRKRGALANGKSARYALTPGRHSLQVMSGWIYKSEPLELELSAGEVVHLACGMKKGVAAALKAMTSPGSALYLVLAAPEAAGQEEPEEGVWDKLLELVEHAGSEGQKPESEPKAGQGAGRSLQIFVSYRREDSPDVCGRIYDRLIRQFGKQAIFKDVDSIPFGVDFRTYLDEMVSRCDVLLAVIGDRWLEAKGAGGKSRLSDPTDYVRIEIESALQRNIPVVPLLVRGAKMPDEAVLPDSIKSLVFRNGLPIRPDPDFHNDMDRLIEGLCGTDQPPAPK